MLLFVLFVFGFLPVRSVSAYADWLRCETEFDGTVEGTTIMNRPIVPSEDQSEDRRVYIEIQPDGSRFTDPWMVATPQDHRDLFPAPSTTTTGTAVEAAATTVLRLRLRVPRSLRRKQVQFVAEVTGEGVSFVGPGVMWGGSRAFSRQHREHVLLRIPSTRAVSGDIELIAGWAAGYGAVNLTPKMIVKRTETTLDGLAGNSSNDEWVTGETDDEL